MLGEIPPAFRKLYELVVQQQELLFDTVGFSRVAVGLLDSHRDSLRFPGLEDIATRYVAVPALRLFSNSQQVLAVQETSRGICPQCPEKRKTNTSADVR
jgi:hypothetical protein